MAGPSCEEPGRGFCCSFSCEHRAPGEYEQPEAHTAALNAGGLATLTSLSSRPRGVRKFNTPMTPSSSPIAYLLLNTCLYRRHTPALISGGSFRAPPAFSGYLVQLLTKIARAILSFSLLRSGP